VAAPAGFKASGVACGIKKSGLDLGLIYSEVPAVPAATFTTNLFKAAPVLISQEIVSNSLSVQAVVVNSGVANAFTGQAGLEAARQMARLTKEVLSLKSEVLVASTGVVGEVLPMEQVKAGIEKAANSLSDSGGDFAQAILTTDTFTKERAYAFELGGVAVTLGGAAKGAGMINPEMATMLAFVTTDLAIETNFLKQVFQRAVSRSFNLITVDGDTSTNDSAFILANGLAGNDLINEESAVSEKFEGVLQQLLLELAEMIVRDGEGATKFLRVQVKGASSEEEAKQAAKTVANSPLVKTAFFGEDPNWGRILVALGYSGVDFNPDAVDLYLGGIQVARGGQAAVFQEEALNQVFQENEIEVLIDLKKGPFSTTVYSTDLSCDYVKINSSYRS
jgi:glutamate N-acetyltransferase/amino-acid N-acetyltransferase